MGGEDTVTPTPAKGPQLLALEMIKCILMICGPKTTVWSLVEE